MGLDSYWALEVPDPEDPEKKSYHRMSMDFDPELRLIGGIMSGYGHDSFRGKSYSDAIERVSGISLYERVLPNAKVRQISEWLQKTSDGDLAVMLKEDWGTTTLDECYQHAKDLKRMFLKFSEANAVLLGWW